MSPDTDFTFGDHEPVHLHASRLGEWASCERRAQHDQLGDGRKKREYPHVAAWVGSCVHARLAGQDEPAKPDLMVWDQRTRNEEGAERQIAHMTDMIRLRIGWQRWTVKTWELDLPPLVPPESDFPEGFAITGRPDLIVKDGFGKLLAVDIKTGAEIRPIDLYQLGTYAAMTFCNSETPDIEAVSILHCPRPWHLAGEPESFTSVLTIDSQFHDLLYDTYALMDRIGAQLDNLKDLGIPNPGWYCKNCTADCVFRLTGTNIE